MDVEYVRTFLEPTVNYRFSSRCWLLRLPYLGTLVLNYRVLILNYFPIKPSTIS